MTIILLSAAIAKILVSASMAYILLSGVVTNKLRTKTPIAVNTPDMLLPMRFVSPPEADSDPAVLLLVSLDSTPTAANTPPTIC
jgi:hypothetical protein